MICDLCRVAAIREGGSPASGWGLPSYQKGIWRSPYRPFYFPGKKERTQWWDETGSTLHKWGN